MPAEQQESGRVLDPLERFAEIVFGLIMVLTFTGSLSVATAGRQEIRTMLIGAIGCNAAWGIVDAVMYLLGGLLSRGRSLIVLKAVQKPGEAGRARGLIADALPPIVASVLRPADLDLMRDRLATLKLPPRPPLTRRDLRGAVGVFLLVFLSTFPVILPFLFLVEPAHAIRLSNLIAVAMLFASGVLLGRHSGLRPVWLGLAMAAIGAVLVSLTIALGG
jgi:VIT1/CCC1 family predicted Fe2+/Mn2+ transporter